MLPRIITADRVGIVTTGLVRLGAIALTVSIIGPWDVIQERRGSDWVTMVYMGEGYFAQKEPTAGWPWILIPLSGVLLFLLVVRPLPFSPTQRWGTMAVAASWFALTVLVLLTATDVVQASMGLGDWMGEGLGGFRYSSPTDTIRLTPPLLDGGSGALVLPGNASWRSGWGGAGLAAWAAVAGLTACLLDLSRAMVGSRRERRITVSDSPDTV